MHRTISTARARLLGLIVLAGVAACSRPADSVAPASGVDPLDLVPVPASGTVTLDGKPLAGAIVALLPESGPTCVGETGSDGRYELSYMGKPGAPAGRYKVAISYMVSAEGVPQGIAPRSALAQPPGMLSAQELLPQKYSDFGQTTLTAVIPTEGTSALNFDLVGPLLERRPEPPAPGEAPSPPP